MKVTSERLPDSRVELRIEADEETSRQAVEATYKELVGRVNVPGFRRGKAPRQLVERMVGRDYVLREAAQLLLPDLYLQAVRETGIDPIYDPDIEVISLEPLAVKVTVPVRPQAQLPDYHAIRIPKPQVAVTDEQVEETLARVREQQAEWVPVERPVREEDRVVIDARGATADGEPVLEQSEIEYLVDESRGIPVPGFATQLLGLAAGEEKEFVLRFAEDSAYPELANQEVTFHVSVRSVKEKRLPEIDDDLAKAVGDFDTLEALREHLRKRIQQEAEQMAANEYREIVVQSVLARTEAEIPAAMVEEQTESSLHSLEDRLQQRGTAMPEFLAATKQSRLDLLENLRQEARETLRRQLMLETVAEREAIEVSDAEVDAQIAETVAVMGEDAERMRVALNESNTRRNIAFRLRQTKAVDRLAEIASQPVAETEAAQGEVN